MKTENKQKKLTSGNGEYYVHFQNEEEWGEIFEWLCENNYENFHRLTKFTPPTFPPVVVIREGTKVFSATNVTCMACLASSGVRAISFAEFLSAIK